jgi:galactokinase
MGDHTDYNQGLALPMAIDRGVTMAFVPAPGPDIVVTSDSFTGSAAIPRDIGAHPDAVLAVTPPWARLVAAMVALGRPDHGGRLHITSDLPVEAGLSSSAALCVALADVFGVTAPAWALAGLCQQAEHLTGAPVGTMDPLVAAAGRRGQALLIDFATSTTRPVPLPGGLEVVVVHSGSHRSLPGSLYAARVAECEAAEARIGPLGTAGPADLTGLKDPALRARARHVVTECRRVRSFADALGAGDGEAAGALMVESHHSLATDYEVSTPALDDLVTALTDRPGVFGARMTGAGFGGCVVALSLPGAVDLRAFPGEAWRVEAADGTLARRESVRESIREWDAGDG